MELALSLGNNTTTNNNNNNNNISNNNKINNNNNNNMDFCMGLSSSSSPSKSKSTAKIKEDDDHHSRKVMMMGSSSSSDPTAEISPPHHQLDLLPFSPLHHRPSSSTLRFPWLSDNLSSEPGSSDGPGSRIMEPNHRATVTPTAEDGENSSPNSGTSSFMEFSLYTRRTNNNNNNNNRSKRRDNNGDNKDEGCEEKDGGGEGGGGGGGSRGGSDDEENGCSTRKKLRLSKEQSAFLEESFKEHHTLNPKQKQALAKELNLRPRQVEVWFQNRRARTKLKQTEVDCEYLKRCCETLTEENRRLQKELHELRALKSSQPFFMHHPATTLTMCPSCERVAPSSTSATSPSPAPGPAPASTATALVVSTSTSLDNKPKS